MVVHVLHNYLLICLNVLQGSLLILLQNMHACRSEYQTKAKFKIMGLSYCRNVLTKALCCCLQTLKCEQCGENEYCYILHILCNMSTDYVCSWNTGKTVIAEPDLRNYV